MNEDLLTSAFTGLRKRFLRFASHLFPDEEDANDALQDAFCRLWDRRETIATAKDAEAIATTTIRNLAIDAFRKRQSVQFVEINDRDSDNAIADPSESMDIEEKYRAVESIIDSKLTETQRYILRRKDYDGESYEEIAQSLGMEQTAVRMQLSRARKTIRECYRNLER